MGFVAKAAAATEEMRRRVSRTTEANHGGQNSVGNIRVLATQRLRNADKRNDSRPIG